MYLKPDEEVSVKALLYGLLLASGNDAAVALASIYTGNQQDFITLMNAKAIGIGANATFFENPNGLDSPGHYSTARDLALLSCYAMENPIFAQTVSTKAVTVGERRLTNHNKLLWQLDGADGIKTGYTKAAGRILVSSAVRQGRRLVAVTINAPNDWVDHKDLHNLGFRNYTVRQLIASGQNLGNVAVISGETDQVALLAAENFSFALADTESPEIIISKPEFVYAPVTAGQDAGVAYICIGDTVVGKIPLIYASEVHQTVDRKESIWDKLIGGARN